MSCGYKKIFLLCFSFYPFFTIAAEPLRCDVVAPIAILINEETGKVLFEKNADKSWHPASTTKIATALYVLRKMEGALDTKVVASYNAVSAVSSAIRRNSGKHPSYRLEFGGTHMGIKVGEELDIRTLLYGLLLSSGNDAANVLGEAVCGSIPVFIEELNAFLLSIGCEHTHFSNPHGLTDEAHQTTARDLAYMAQEAMKNPIFQEMVSTERYERKETNKQPSFWLAHTNGLIRKGNKYYYPYATGVKTGYTMKAGFNAVTSAQRGDRKLIGVVCGCDEVGKRYRSLIQMFEAAFQEEKKTRQLLSKEHDFFHQSIVGAKNQLDAFLEEDVFVSYYPSEEQEFFLDIVWFSQPLPIVKGEEVGVLRLLNIEKKECKRFALLARETVEPTSSYLFKQKSRIVFAFIQQYKVYGGYALAVLFFCLSLFPFRKKWLRR